MANSLGNQAVKYTALLDEIVTAETKTADLAMSNELVGEFTGVGQIQIAKMALDGLGDYSRENGFPAGSINLDWETLTLTHDRGREFSIDVMDDEERERIASQRLMTEFVRTRVNPEVDAIRFATLAAKAGTTATGTLTVDNIVAAIATAEAAVSEESDLDGCILYATRPVINLLASAMPYRLGQGEDPNHKFAKFDDMKVVAVPQARFYSAIDLADGTTSGETAGGYTKAATGKNINFLIVNPKAAKAVQKHQALRYFSPEVNQTKDAHKWQYRLFHDLLVPENKASLIYAHVAAN